MVVLRSTPNHKPLKYECPNYFYVVIRHAYLSVDLKDFKPTGGRWFYHGDMTSVTKVAHYFLGLWYKLWTTLRLLRVSHIIHLPALFTLICVLAKGAKMII